MNSYWGSVKYWQMENLMVARKTHYRWLSVSLSKLTQRKYNNSKDWNGYVVIFAGKEFNALCCNMMFGQGYHGIGMRSDLEPQTEIANVYIQLASR